MSLPVNQVVQGDAFAVLKEFPSESIDCVVTDPPYGIGFMGKEWDKALPPKEAFVEMHRVLKSGALAFVMSSPRQDVLWRMLAMLEGCGFQLRQSFVSWVYKSGFPKAYDVSKGIDKKLGQLAHRKIIGKKSDFAIDRANRNPDKHGPKTKEIYGKYDSGTWSQNMTEPASDLAKKWSGWKSVTGLKPALECILMVNKPLAERTIVDNVLAHGVGAINVDACRIPLINFEDKKHRNSAWSNHEESTTFHGQKYRNLSHVLPPKGRFPANLLVSDKALDTGKISKSTGGVKSTSQTIGGRGIYQGGDKRPYYNYGDVGGQSRYFDLDAWARHHGFLDVAKASKQERNMGLKSLEAKLPKRYGVMKGTPEHAPNRQNPQKNIHPTVKPVKLMAYLVELGCPKDGVVLDPFVGSGTTCLASHQLGRKWIGIEIDPEYVEIAKHRIATLSQHLSNFIGVEEEGETNK